MANPIVTSLPNYIEERRLPLIAEAVLGAKSARLFTLQSDIKHSAALNLLSTNVEFGDGMSCGWDEAGEATLTQRILTVGNMKVNMAFCDKALLDKWAGYQVRVAAGRETMPFEEDFVNQVIKNIQETIEIALYQGDTASSTPNLAYFDGLIKILTDATGTIDVTASSGTAYEKVMQIYTSIPEKAFSRGDVAILVGMDVFRTFTAELIEKNLYHYNVGTPDGEIILPGTNVRVIGVNGLNATNKAIAASLRNIFYGTDMMNDEEVFDFWYSRDNREFRLAIYFNAGTQVAFPDEVVLAALA